MPAPMLATSPLLPVSVRLCGYLLACWQRRRGSTPTPGVDASHTCCGGRLRTCVWRARARS